MTPSEINDLIAAEVGGGRSPSDTNGVDLERCLVTPSRRVYEDSFREGQTIELWLVLEERPGEGSGYKIVFDEGTRRFGLAASSTAGRDVFIGFYGSFVETLEGM
jgi:hypothetical protein